MTKVLTHSILVASFIFLLAAPQALALTIRLTPESGFVVTSDDVLGDEAENDDSDENEDTEDTPKPNSEPKKAEQHIQNTAGQQLRIVPMKDRVKVELESKARTTEKNAKLKEEEAKRLKLNMPAGLTKKQRQAYETKLEQEKERRQKKNEQIKTKFQERIETERDERSDEEIELKNEVDEDGERLEIKTREIKANLPKTPLIINPETKELQIETPTGELKVLRTLPDQAIERLKAAGVLVDNQEFDSASLEVEVRSDQKLQYTARVAEKKRFLGLINRQVDKRVMVDDETGEISTEAIPAASIWGRFLNSLSY